MNRKSLLFIGLIFFTGILVVIVSQLPQGWLVFKPEYLVSLSSVLTLFSFIVRGILALRLLAISAQLIFIPYCLLQPTPLWTPVIWNSLFISVNIVNVIILLLEKRPVKFSLDEQRLYDLAFDSLTRREFLKVVHLGEWHDGEAGEVLVRSGEITAFVAILCRGKAVAILDNLELISIPEGKLMGLSSILAKEPMLVSIKLTEPSRYMCWNVESLNRYLESKPELRAKLRAIVSTDLARTVRIVQEYHIQGRLQANMVESVLSKINTPAQSEK